jgi:hypothetical protein
MPRKSDEQLNLEERHRLWKERERKARTHKERMDAAKILKDIEGRLWPNPADEAKAVEKAARAERKAQKAAAVEREREQKAELERLKELERRKVWEETNPVLEQARRAEVREELRKREEAAMEIEASPQAENPQLEAPQTGEQLPGDGVASSEMVRVTREAEASALRQSTGAELDDFFRKMAQPIEPTSPTILDIVRAVSRPLDDDEVMGSVGMTNSVLASKFTDNPQPEVKPEHQGMELVQDAMGHQTWRKREQEW